MTFKAFRPNIINFAEILNIRAKYFPNTVSIYYIKVSTVSCKLIKLNAEHLALPSVSEPVGYFISIWIAV